MFRSIGINYHAALRESLQIILFRFFYSNRSISTLDLNDYKKTKKIKTWK